MSVTYPLEDRSLSEAQLDCLTDERRRTVLHYLRANGSVSRHELATKVAADERNATVATVPERAVERVELTLHHSHLPKLDEAGLLSYDRANGMVTDESGGKPLPMLSRSQ